MGSIYLIRHGQASFGADDYDVLSPTGVRQAEILGQHLADLGICFDRCLAGDLRRQQHTATSALEQFSARGLPVPVLETDSAFNEFDADAVIRALLPAMLPEEPEALDDDPKSIPPRAGGDLNGCSETGLEIDERVDVVLGK